MAPASSISERVLDSLVSAGLMTAEQVASVIDAASSRGVHVGSVLAERDMVSAIDVVSVLEHEMGVPQVDLSSYAPEDEALALVPARLARDRRILPLFEIEGMLTVAVGDPMDVFALDSVAAELGLELEPVLAESSSFESTLEQYYPSGSAAAETEMAPPPPVAAEIEEFAASDFFEETAEEETPAVPVAPVAEAPSEQVAEVRDRRDHRADGGGRASTSGPGRRSISTCSPSLMRARSRSSSRTSSTTRSPRARAASTCFRTRRTSSWSIA